MAKLAVVLDLDTGTFERKMDDLPKTAKKAGGKLRKAFTGAAKAVGAFSVGIGVAAVKAASDFEKRMANVNTLLGPKSTKTMEMLKKQILALPPELGTAEQLASGLYETISAGVEPTKAVQFLADTAKLAKAGLADMGETTKTLTKTLTAYGLDASKAGSVSDQLFKTVELGQTNMAELSQAFGRVTSRAASLKIPLNEMLGATAQLTQVLPNTNQTMTALNQIMGDIQKPTQQAVKEAKALNIEFGPNAIKNAGGFVKFLEELKTKTAGKDGAIAKLFGGREGAAAIDALFLKMDSFKDRSAKIAEAAESNGAVVALAFKKQTETLDEQLKALSTAINKVGIELGTEFLPEIKKVTKELLDNMDSIKAAARALFNLLKTIKEGVAFISQGLGAASVAAERLARGETKGAAAALGGGEKTEAALGFATTTGLTPGGAGAALAQEVVTPRLIAESLPGVGGFIRALPRRQEGGPLAAGQAALVGEKGPEVFVPSAAGTVVPNGGGGALPGMAGLGGGPSEGISELGAKVREFFKGVTASGVKAGVIAGGKAGTGSPKSKGKGGLANSIFRGTLGGAKAALLSGDARAAGDFFSKGFGNVLKEEAKKAIISALGKKLLGKLGGFGIPGFQEGTESAPGGLALVGERGPELVNLPRGSQVIPNERLGGTTIDLSGAQFNIGGDQATEEGGREFALGFAEKLGELAEDGVIPTVARQIVEAGSA